MLELLKEQFFSLYSDVFDCQKIAQSTNFPLLAGRIEKFYFNVMQRMINLGTAILIFQIQLQLRIDKILFQTAIDKLLLVTNTQNAMNAKF